MLGILVALAVERRMYLSSFPSYSKETPKNEIPIDN